MMNERVDEESIALLDALESRGSDPFLRSTSRTVAAGEVLERVRRIGDVFDRSGLTPGDVVALRGLSVWDAAPTLLAAWSRGLIAHLQSVRQPGLEAQRLLDAVRARLLIADDASWRPAHTPLLDAKGLSGAVVVKAAASEAPLELPTGAATLLCTSGSSGPPKIAVHALRQHIASARGAIMELGLAAGDGWLLSLPIHHVGGLAIIFRAILGDAMLFVPEPKETLGAAVAGLAPTHVSLVDTQLSRLLRDETAAIALARCRRVLIGGGPLSSSLRRHALDRGLPLVVSYGSTESTALMAASAEPEVVSRPNSAGRVLPGRELRVSADGVLRIGGPNLFLGYLEDGRLRDPRDPDGLFETGDLGQLDQEGVLYVVGRSDRMFVSGGENVHPGEIESLLEEAEGVVGAIVVPVRNEEFGQRPVAFIACDTPPPRRRDLQARLRRHLPGFKVPDAFYHLPERWGEGSKGDREMLAALLDRPEALRPLE